MSKLYLSGSDGEMPVINRKKPSSGPPRSGERISRRELLDFIVYLQSKNTVSDQTAFTVSEHSVRGAYNAYGYLTNRLTGQSGDRLILAYRDNDHRLDKEMLISLAEFFCRQTGMPEMWLRNLNEETVTVIRQRKSDADDAPAASDHPIETMARVGSFSSFIVGIYPGDGVYPHFHLLNRKTGQKLAISLQDPEYYRHNAEKPDCLTEKDASALADWLDRPEEELKALGFTLTHFQYLCVLWNQNTGKEKLSLPFACPDYRRLPTT